MKVMLCKPPSTLECIVSKVRMKLLIPETVMNGFLFPLDREILRPRVWLSRTRLKSYEDYYTLNRLGKDCFLGEEMV